MIAAERFVAVAGNGRLRCLGDKDKLFTIRSRSSAGTETISAVTPAPQANETYRNSRPLLWILPFARPCPAGLFVYS
jgi:hypothetical protein